MLLTHHPECIPVGQGHACRAQSLGCVAVLALLDQRPRSPRIVLGQGRWLGPLPGPPPAPPPLLWLDRPLGLGPEQGLLPLSPSDAGLLDSMPCRAATRGALLPRPCSEDAACQDIAPPPGHLVPGGGVDVLEGGGEGFPPLHTSALRHVLHRGDDGVQHLLPRGKVNPHPWVDWRPPSPGMTLGWRPALRRHRGQARQGAPLPTL